MQKLLTLSSIFLLTITSVVGQYAIADIPESLTKNANLVIRDSEMIVKINSKNEATVYRKKVISLLNSDASDHAYIAISYDNLNKISNIKIKLYDKDGEAVKVRTKHLQDINTSMDGFGIDDTYVKVLDLSDIEFPFSYELEYETKKKGIFSLPSWKPQYARNMSLEKASVSIHSKKGYQYKYKEYNLEGSEKSEKGDYDIISWSVDDLVAVKREPYQGTWTNSIPLLKIAPEEFEYEGYEGSMKTWNDFGIWYNQLLDDTKAFPEKMQAEIKEMVKDIDTDLEKIKFIYQYLQDNTRYVSIQLGIGGYKPFDPDFVHEKKYGDCKALSYYTQAMLESVNIPSNVVLVKAGRNEKDVDANFPSNQFNHLFLCVPQEKDTIWLECTSQTVPFGHLGNFTSDRNVLVINEEGGKITRTPKYGKAENKTIANVKININSEGAASGNIRHKFSGLEYDKTHFSFLLTQSEKEQEDWIKSYYDISDFSLSSYEFSTEEVDCLGSLKSEIECRKLASTVGRRMFFKPIVVNKAYAKKMKNPEERKTDFNITTAYNHQGTYEFDLPKEYQIEKNIKESEIKNKYGSYSLKIKSVEDGKIILERNLEVNDGEFPANEYVDFVAFLNQIKKSDNQKIALVMTKEP